MFGNLQFWRNVVRTKCGDSSDFQYSLELCHSHLSNVYTLRMVRRHKQTKITFYSWKPWSTQSTRQLKENRTIPTSWWDSQDSQELFHSIPLNEAIWDEVSMERTTNQKMKTRRISLEFSLCSTTRPFQRYGKRNSNSCVRNLRLPKPSGIVPLNPGFLYKALRRSESRRKYPNKERVWSKKRSSIHDFLPTNKRGSYREESVVRLPKLSGIVPVNPGSSYIPL